MIYTYTLFDGLTYNMRKYFASCIVFFRNMQENMRAMSKMSVHIHVMLNYQIRDLLFHYANISLLKPGHYTVIRSHILHILLTLYGETA